MFEQVFKNVDDILRKEAGCTTELDYTEQTSWLLFLKYLDALEQDKATEARFEGKRYTFILAKQYRWEEWAAPKAENGQIDHNKAMTGDDLIDFVNGKLFPYLHGFQQKASGPNTIEYKIGEIFGEIKNRIRSGYNLRDVIDHIDELRFRSQAEKHELSHLYEAKIRNMGNAGRNGGEYYTPRPLIRAMIQVVQPQIGDRIYDGACGSAGFLCESFDYLKASRKLTTRDLKTLQERTFVGKEKKSLAYVIAIMNMILHGIEAPTILHTNTLTENLADIQEKDRFEVILANPPFGGKERKEVQQNFPIRSGETAFLFLQHFMKMLKAGGRAGVVIKNTFLSNTDNASVSLRKQLLETCNLHTVLDCPSGTFQGAGVKTVVLFFEKGAPTRKVWYYQLDPGRNLGKTNPLNDDDLAEFVKLQKTKAESPKSWAVDAKSIDKMTFDLSVKNPHGAEVVAYRSPQKIIAEIAASGRRERGSASECQEAAMKAPWQDKLLGEVLQLEYGKPLDDTDRKPNGLYPVYGANGEKARSDKFYFDKLSIIVGRKGSAGEVNLTEKKFWPLDVTYFVTFDERQYHLQFLYYLLAILDLPSLAKGVKPGINRSEIYSKVVRIPPLCEQQRIAGILDQAFEGIATAKANAEKNLQNARALFESHLQGVFIQRGEGWVERRLSEVSRDFGRGKSKHRPRNDPRLYGGKYPFIQTGEVRNSDHLITSYNQSYSEEGLAQSKLWPKGTLCITIAANIAETGILDFDACFPDSVIGVVVDRNVTSNKFLEYLLQSFKARLQAEGKGSAQDNINLGTFENQRFPFPSLRVQDELVATLDSLREETQRLASIYQQKLAALDELKKSLLHQAFSGHSRTPP